MIRALIFDLHGVLVLNGSVSSDMIHLLKKQKAQHRNLYILSNFSREAAAKYRQDFPALFALFDDAFFAGETGLLKPDPNAFLQIMTREHFKPDECIFIDDAPEHVEAAKSLGMNAVLYRDVAGLSDVIAQEISRRIQ